jgi:phospholipid N-methyltransferase
MTSTRASKQQPLMMRIGACVRTSYVHARRMIETVQVVPEKVVASMVYVPVDVAITRMLLDTRN